MLLDNKPNIGQDDNERRCSAPSKAARPGDSPFFPHPALRGKREDFLGQGQGQPRCARRWQTQGGMVGDLRDVHRLGKGRHRGERGGGGGVFV